MRLPPLNKWDFIQDDELYLLHTEDGEFALNYYKGRSTGVFRFVLGLLSDSWEIGFSRLYRDLSPPRDDFYSIGNSFLKKITTCSKENEYVKEYLQVPKENSIWTGPHISYILDQGASMLALGSAESICFSCPTRIEGVSLEMDITFPWIEENEEKRTPFYSDDVATQVEALLDSPLWEKLYDF